MNGRVVSAELSVWVDSAEGVRQQVLLVMRKEAYGAGPGPAACSPRKGHALFGSRRRVRGTDGGCGFECLSSAAGSCSVSGAS